MIEIKVGFSLTEKCHLAIISPTNNGKIGNIATTLVKQSTKDKTSGLSFLTIFVPQKPEN